jgi:hypothetical protein
MARTIRVKVYKFTELSEEAKQKAIEWFAAGNLDYEWWEAVYEDAGRVGIKITSFDIDRGGYCNGDFKEDALYTANKILEEHGEQCESYKTAEAFIKEREEIITQAPKDENGELIDEYELDEKLDECEEEFRKSILEDFRIILSKEYDYLTSEEAIKESIISNEYEFTIDGKRF